MFIIKRKTHLALSLCLLIKEYKYISVSRLVQEVQHISVSSSTKMWLVAEWQPIVLQKLQVLIMDSMQVHHYGGGQMDFHLWSWDMYLQKRLGDVMACTQRPQPGVTVKIATQSCRQSFFLLIQWQEIGCKMSASIHHKSEIV